MGCLEHREHGRQEMSLAKCEWLRGLSESVVHSLVGMHASRGVVPAPAAACAQLLPVRYCCCMACSNITHSTPLPPATIEAIEAIETDEDGEGNSRTCIWG